MIPFGEVSDVQQIRATQGFHTLAARICGFLVGAALDYLYLSILERVTSSNLIFLLFFSVVFAVLINELVGQYSLCGLKVNRITMFFTETRIPETTVKGPRTILI